jgi:hypothetical protein
MPRVFLSYSHDDEAFVTELEKQLPSVGWDVWLDVHNLRAGDRWPRKLGDAIAASEAFVLVWSAHAALSDFVDLEWATAVALKRPICILTLDREPRPTILSSYQAHPASPADTAAQWLSGITLEKAAPADAAAPVLEKLAATTYIEPSRIAAELRATFVQQGWNVSGPVYQSAGDMHVHIDRKDSWKSLYIPAVVVILAIVIGTLVYRPHTVSSSTEREAVMQPFGGFVQDEQGLPLEGVTVMAPTQNVTVVTDRLGHFSFQVRLPANTNFRLVARKPGYEVRTSDPFGGDTTFNFTLRKSAKTQ